MYWRSLLLLGLLLSLTSCMQFSGDFFCWSPCPGPAGPPQDLGDYYGVWVNQEVQANRISRIRVFLEATGNKLQLWELCNGTECDRGSTITFLSEEEGNPLKVRWWIDSAEVPFELEAWFFKIDANQLQATIKRTFYDGEDVSHQETDSYPFMRQR